MPWFVGKDIGDVVVREERPEEVWENEGGALLAKDQSGDTEREPTKIR